MLRSAADDPSFVAQLAEHLKLQHLEPRPERWAIPAGGSILDHILAEGIRDAEFMLFLLPGNGAEQAGLLEELDVAVVRRLGRLSRLGVVIADGGSAPRAFDHVPTWRIDRTVSLAENLDRIAVGLVGSSDPPLLGRLAEYAEHFTHMFGPNGGIDGQLLRVAGRRAFAAGSDTVYPHELCTPDGKPLMPDAQMTRAVKMLIRQGFASATLVAGRSLPTLRLSTLALGGYGSTFMADYYSVVHDVVAAIVYKGGLSLDAVAAQVGKSPFLVLHVLKLLRNAGHVQFPLDTVHVRIHEVRPSLRRALAVTNLRPVVSTDRAAA